MGHLLLWLTLVVSTPLELAREQRDSEETVTTRFIPEGVTKKVGGYRPNRATMDQAADIIATVPDGVTAPSYGFVSFNDKKWAFLLDQPEEGDHRLFVDTNGDGDLTNDPEASWSEKKQGPRLMYEGSAMLDLGEGRLGRINLNRFDPNDEARQSLANTILIYEDFCTEISFQLDE